MSAGPLRRLVGTLGLLALVPTALLLLRGSVTVTDAAVRGGATLVAVVVLGRVAGWMLSFLAGEFERAGDGSDGTPAAAGPERRR